MCLRGIEWLSRRVQEFGSLSENEKGAILDFSLLWSFFEGTKLDCVADIPAIRNYVKSIERDGSLCQLNIDNYLQYLRDRYFANGVFTGFYNDLHLENERRKKPPEVDRMLQGDSISKNRRFNRMLSNYLSPEEQSIPW